MQVEFSREITQHKDQEDESPSSPESLKKWSSDLSIKRKMSSRDVRINNFDGAADGRKSRRMGKRDTSKDPKTHESVKETCTSRLHAQLEQKDTVITHLHAQVVERDKDIADLHATLEIPEYKGEKYWLEVKKRCLCFL